MKIIGAAGDELVCHESTWLYQGLKSGARCGLKFRELLSWFIGTVQLVNTCSVQLGSEMEGVVRGSVGDEAAETMELLCR